MSGAHVPIWYGPCAGALGLLVAGGSAKLAKPGGAVRALRGMGIRVPAAAVRVLALAEVAAGASALGGKAIGAAAAGVLYLGFAGFVGAGLARGGRSECGCFGEEGSAPTWTHLLINLACAALALVAARGPIPPVSDVVAALGWAAPAFVILSGTAAYLGYLFLAAAPGIRRVAQGGT